MSIPNDVVELIQWNARSLDRLELGTWLETFAEVTRYEITTAENERNGWPLGLMHATNKNQLRDRVASIESVNVYEPHRYRHILSPTLIPGPGVSDQYITPFVVYRITPSKPTVLFVTGEYRDRVVTVGGRAVFAERRVVLDNDQIDTLLAIPL